jgi:hypothetical protein
LIALDGITWLMRGNVMGSNSALLYVHIHMSKGLSILFTKGGLGVSLVNGA